MTTTSALPANCLRILSPKEAAFIASLGKLNCDRQGFVPLPPLPDEIIAGLQTKKVIETKTVGQQRHIRVNYKRIELLAGALDLGDGVAHPKEAPPADQQRGNIRLMSSACRSR